MPTLGQETTTDGRILGEVFCGRCYKFFWQQTGVTAMCVYSSHNSADPPWPPPTEGPYGDPVTP